MLDKNEKIIDEIENLVSNIENIQEQIDAYCMFVKQSILNTSNLN